MITGGSRGIGKAIVTRLWNDGWSVAFTYYSSSEAAAELEAIAETTPDRPVVAIRADVSDKSLAAMVESRAVERLGGLTALVNNAGIRKDVLAYNMTDEDWRSVMETNLDGAFFMSRAVVPRMLRQRRGAIVNIASLSAMFGVAGQVNYSAAKGGLVAMTRSLARELARSGIRVNCVAPGLVETDMISGLDAEARKEMIRAVPMRRTIKPEEVAAAVAFLLSDDAGAITGQTIRVDGGASA